MSVVGSDWESLKKFNLAEIYQPKSATRNPVETSTIGAETGVEATKKEATTNIAQTDEVAS